MIGRPTSFTPDAAAKICDRLACGESLRSICRDEEFPAESTVRLWVIENREGFSAQYARARDMGADARADEILEISDDGSNDWMDQQRKDGTVDRVIDREHVARSKLRVDSRMWLLSKQAPKKYGDRSSLELSGPDGGAMKIEAIRRVIVDPKQGD